MTDGQKKAAIVGLTLAMNAAMGLTQFKIVADGSLAANLCALAAFLIGNALALFGAPVMGSKPDLPAPPEPKKESGKVPVSILAAIALGALMIFAAALGGCAASFKQAAMVESAADVALKDASQAFQDYDQAHQQAIVAGAKTQADAEAQLKAYRDKVQKPIVEAFHAAADALKALQDSLDASKGITSHNFGAALGKLYGAIADLAKLLADVGVKLPFAIPGAK